MDAQVIQIGTLQALLGFSSLILTLGIYLGQIKSSARHIEEDIKDIKAELKVHGSDIAGLKAHTSYSIAKPARSRS